MTDKSVLITGGGGGIGAACAQKFASHGYRVHVVGRRNEPLQGVVQAIRERGGHADAHPCDVTDEHAVSALFAEVGRLDVLVNNAGSSDTASFRRTTVQDVETSFRTNALSVFLCSRLALGPMLEHGSGRVVTVASISSLVGLRNISAYTGAKHAALGYVRTLAAELAGTGITSNAVCPTYVRTPMTDQSVARITSRTGRSTDEAESVLVASSHLGRLLEPEEVAHSVAFFASDLASGINGQTLVVDGGGIQH